MAHAAKPIMPLVAWEAHFSPRGGWHGRCAGNVHMPTMSRRFVVASAVALLSLAACTASVDERSPEPAPANPAPANPAPADPAPANPAPGQGGACVWEGPVNYKLLAVRESSEHVFLRGSFAYSFCGGGTFSREATLRIVKSTGVADEIAELPADGVDRPIDGTTTTVGPVDAFVTEMDSSNCTDLRVGTYRAADAGVIDLFLTGRPASTNARCRGRTH